VSSSGVVVVNTVWKKRITTPDYSGSTALIPNPIVNER
jgi:hypothetical protein